MKLMTFNKYNRSILLILAITLCLSVLSKAQTVPTDSVPEKQNNLINIAYGLQPDWMVTGAVSSVKGSDIQSPFTPNFPNRLYGRIPGLSVVTGGTEPGNENTTVYSRGVNTFGVGGTEMLILVDGLPANYADLTSEEVESVTLLKDASATALYGARGANGVLLVTTKRGAPGELKVVFSSQHGVQRATRLSEYLGSYDYATLYNEALVNDGKPELYTADDLSAYQSGNDPYFHPDVNWNDEVLQKSAYVSNYNLNFSGGNDVVKYFVMLSHIKNDNLYRRTEDESQFSINGGYQRVNFRSNIDINVTKNFSASMTLGGTVVDQANPYATTTYPVFTLMSQIPPNAFPVHNPNGTFGRNSLYTNPLGDILNSGFYTSNGRTLQTVFGVTEKLGMITKGLSLSARIAFNSYFLSQSNKTRTYASYSIEKDLSGEPVYTQFGLDESLSASEGASDQNRSFAFQSFLNYDRNFGLSNLSGVLMFNADDYVISGNNFPIKHNNIGGRFTYAYNQKYIGEVSFSYMGSANFPKDGRYGLFPAMSLGWIVSNESFLKDNTTINFLKIRGSYGMVGNDVIGGTPFMFDQYYPYSGNYFFGTANSSSGGIIQGAPANAGVTWEKEKSYNFGLEATILNHVDISLDVFNRDRYDILVLPLSTDPDFMGYTKPHLNQGKANNKGFEGTVRVYNDESKDFRFFVEASAWYYKNKIVYNSEALQLYDYLNRTGRPIGQPYGLVAVGFFKDPADIASSPSQLWSVVQPGDMKYKDQNDDHVIDQNDLYPIGKTGLPNLTVGLHLGLQYKGFDFDAFLQGVNGRTVTFDGYYFQAFQNNGKAGPIALERWTPATAETATYPRLSSVNNDNNYRYSTLWQHDGSFIKLRSIELGYTLPAKISNAVMMENTRVFVNGTNLFSLDHMDGYRDPEVGASYYPAVRSFSVGVRVQFK
jgi:TonB-linked SusC/RagA family outer membrane protein